MHFFRGLQGCRNSNASSKQNSLNQGVISICKPKLKADQAKLLAAHKHSESERRRRMGINGQYATLRTILPNLIKMDKASVLAETIRRVRELKKAVEEVEEVCCTVPDVDDELRLEVGEDHEESAGLVLIKATLSCEDRPGLMLELINALKSVKRGVELRVVKAEMMTAGGRTKTVLWLRRRGAGSGGRGYEHDDDNEAILVMLRRTLKVVLAKRANGKC
ncbi:Basic helix-loop-helix transcription factor [Parasponia andersonii]|uniref:Basic helix-loop-helix transcription factor n=1 Tax=Parasponia andersonii TaxID=3476 RepID=A0A2P5AQH2_PARAD|nr:Basic helix-loop-helix transcription factor [Parasponia andersonii]